MEYFKNICAIAEFFGMINGMGAEIFDLAWVDTFLQFFSLFDTLQMEMAEFSLIKYPERGSCLYRCGNERYLLQVHAPEYKEKLFGKAGGR